MTRQNSYFAATVVLHCFLLAWTAVNSVVHANEDTPPSNACRLYMAPSYLSTDDGVVFGIFAGQAFSKDDLLPSHDLAVPLFDFLTSPSVRKSDRSRAVADALERALWVSEYAGSQFEGNSSKSAFFPGVGALAQYHSGYANLDWTPSSMVTRQADELKVALAGQAHASRGAITDYYNATLRATQDIPLGMELFISYGRDADDDDDEPDVYQERITAKDFRTADALLDKILAFYKSHGPNMSDDLQAKVLSFMLDTILPGADGKHAKVIRSLLPSHPSQLQGVRDAGGTFLYRNADMIHDKAWLETNGLCIDNLEARRSTVPNAGRGAFVRRPLVRGDVISPVPMVPILMEEVLDLYHPDAGRVGEGPLGQHLLMNYCFGHGESNLLLLPTAPMVNYINHAPSKDKVNAFLMWSKHDKVFNDHDSHDRALQHWRVDDPPVVTMVLVANKDLAPGDEIFIDYGDDWAAAWKQYEATVDTTAKWPLTAVDVRSRYSSSNNVPYPINIKVGQVPYPQGVVTACFIQKTSDMPDGTPRQNDAGLQIMRWLPPPPNVDGLYGQNLGVCDLTGRQDDGNGSYEYTVVTRLSEDEMVEVHKVPHAAILLVDRPYHSDLHTQGAFRRYIGLEDQRFPQAWRNLR